MIILALPAYRHSENPYTTLLYRAIESRGHQVIEWTPMRSVVSRYDVLHLHWPDAYLNRRFFVAAAANAVAVVALAVLAHIRGAAVVWTVHNISEHDGRYPRLEALAKRLFVRRLDGLICLSAASAAEVRHHWPVLDNVPVAVARHGDYRPAYPEPGPRPVARAELALDADSAYLLFVGQIRRYKNVPALVQAFRNLHDPSVKLIVAGAAPDPDVASEVASLCVADPRITLRMGFVEEDTMVRLVAAADLAVLPFRSILNSGSAMLALSFGTPVLVPSTPSLVEMRALVGEDWVRLFTPPLTADDLENALSRPAIGEPDLTAYSWSVIARTTVDLYAQALDRRPRGKHVCA